jgi:glycosyltransferase involved in cell wall biosynthesis
MRRPRLVYMVTHPASARVLLSGQLRFMQAWGFDVTLIASPGPDLEVSRAREEVAVREVAMARDVALLLDATALSRLVSVLRSLRPDIVIAGTPKAGLLGMVAARMLRVPVRIYFLLGLRLETSTGLELRVLGTTERIAAWCAHDVICVSHSLREAFVAGGYAPAHKVRVRGESTNGIDTDRFAPTAEVLTAAARVRGELGIPAAAPVIGFIGRLNRDKGIVDLLDAFDQVRTRHTDGRLLLVSADLADEDTARDVAERIPRTPGVIRVPFVEDVPPVLARDRPPRLSVIPRGPAQRGRGGRSAGGADRRLSSDRSPRCRRRRHDRGAGIGA